MIPDDLLLPSVASGYMIMLVVRTTGEVASWFDERRTDRLAQ